MTPQERQLLESLATRVAGTPVAQKDPEADALIQQKLGSAPDALYVLTQTVLIQEMALNQANNRLHDLQQQIDSHRGEQTQQPTSFLGRLFGTGAASRPAPPPTYQPPAYGAPQYAPQYEPIPYQQAPSGASSFLRSAATTATGVAAGALAFEGIESLFGHHGGFGGNSFGGGEFLGGGGGPSETIVNNYYDEPGASGERERFSGSDAAGSQQGETDYNDASLSDLSGGDASGSDASGSDTSDYDSSSGFDSGNSGDDFSSTDV